MVIKENSHCALVLVTELVQNDEKKGCTIHEISQKHHIPQELLEPVVRKLCDAEIVREQGDEKWLRLQRDAKDITAYEVIMLFEDDAFSGKFFDTQNGKVLPESEIATLINEERKHMARYIKSRYKRINLLHWSKTADRLYRQKHPMY